MVFLTVFATLDAQPHIGRKDASGRRQFLVPYVSLAYNDANVRVMDPLRPIAGTVKPNRHVRVTEVIVKTTGDNSRAIRSSLSFQRSKLAQAPDIQPEPIYHTLSTDSGRVSFDFDVDPQDDNDLTLTIAGYGATDNIWIFVKGWFDES